MMINAWWLVPISMLVFSTGFIFGSAWRFIHDRNHEIDRELEKRFKEIDEYGK